MISLHGGETCVCCQVYVPLYLAQDQVTNAPETNCCRGETTKARKNHLPQGAAGSRNLFCVLEKKVVFGGSTPFFLDKGRFFLHENRTPKHGARDSHMTISIGSRHIGEPRCKKDVISPNPVNPRLLQTLPSSQPNLGVGIDTSTISASCLFLKTLYFPQHPMQNH